MLIPKHSSIFSYALGLLIKSIVSVGLPICYIFACQDFGVSSALGIAVAGLLGVWMLAVLFVMWAAGPFDVSIEQIKKNVPGWFNLEKRKIEPAIRNNVDAPCIYQTRYLAVPTPPPRFCLADREAFVCRH